MGDLNLVISLRIPNVSPKCPPKKRPQNVPKMSPKRPPTVSPLLKLQPGLPVPEAGGRRQRGGRGRAGPPDHRHGLGQRRHRHPVRPPGAPLAAGGGRFGGDTPNLTLSPTPNFPPQAAIGQDERAGGGPGTDRWVWGGLWGLFGGALGFFGGFLGFLGGSV